MLKLYLVSSAGPLYNSIAILRSNNLSFNIASIFVLSICR